MRNSTAEEVLVQAALLQIPNEQLLALSSLLAFDPARVMGLVGAECNARSDALQEAEHDA